MDKSQINITSFLLCSLPRLCVRRISRKEAKESVFFLELVEIFGNVDMQNERVRLADEANQLKKIFSSMLLK